MSLTETTRPGPPGTLSRCVRLRQTSREGSQGNHRTLAHLVHCTPQNREAPRLALPHQEALAVVRPLHSAPLHAGRSVGAVWVLEALARRFGIAAALGTDGAGQRARGQGRTRVLAQGSRLSAGRLAQTPAACAVLPLRRGFEEHDRAPPTSPRWRPPRGPSCAAWARLGGAPARRRCCALPARAVPARARAPRGRPGVIPETAHLGQHPEAWAWGCGVTQRACPGPWSLGWA
jgi:hypothetical protein